MRGMRDHVSTFNSPVKLRSHVWPDPDAARIAPGAAERVRAAHTRGKHPVRFGTPPLFHTFHYVRGFEPGMIDIALHRDILRGH